MVFPPISHMPFLSLESSHLPGSSSIRSLPDLPVGTGRVRTLQNRKLHIRYLHLQPASQITQRMPQWCFLYTSTRRRAKSPLRTMEVQDRAKTVRPNVRTRRRIQGPNESFAREALSDTTSSHSRIVLLPSRRRRAPEQLSGDAPKSPALRPRLSYVRAIGSTRGARESAEIPP